MSEVKENKSKFFMPILISLIGSIVIIISVFLPYATATEDYKEDIENHPDLFAYSSLDLTYKDMENISMFKYARIYNNISEQVWGNKFYGIFYICLPTFMGIFALLAILFSAKKKPIVALIFNVLAFLIFAVQNSDYNSRGVIPSKLYDWGIAYYIIFIASAAAIVGNVWMLIQKIKINKQNKAANS